MAKAEKTKKNNKQLTKRQKDLIFYILLLAFPIAQFLVFYIGVNFSSVLMAFQKYDLTGGTITWTLDNFTNAFTAMTRSSNLLSAAKMSVLSYLITLVIGTPLGLFFSYYIYKKFAGSGLFRVLLFMPSIVSAIVMVTMFQFFVEEAIPTIVKTISGISIKGLIENPDSRYATIMFYNLWVSFGTSVLMYSNGMSAISQEIVESAHLDGAKGFKEFWHITLPLVFPTLTTFLITGVATIFTSQINLYSFYGSSAPESLQTYGYYLYTKTRAAASRAEYPILSAMGLMMTVIAVPLTLIVKNLLEKFGPKED